MLENQAAWITAPAEYPFTVNSAPKAEPGPGEVVIKNVAVAIVSPISIVLLSYHTLFLTVLLEPC